MACFIIRKIGNNDTEDYLYGHALSYRDHRGALERSLRLMCCPFSIVQQNDDLDEDTKCFEVQNGHRYSVKLTLS